MLNTNYGLTNQDVVWKLKVYGFSVGENSLHACMVFGMAKLGFLCSRDIRDG